MQMTRLCGTVPIAHYTHTLYVYLWGFIDVRVGTRWHQTLKHQFQLDPLGKILRLIKQTISSPIRQRCYTKQTIKKLLGKTNWPRLVARWWWWFGTKMARSPFLLKLTEHATRMLDRQDILFQCLLAPLVFNTSTTDILWFVAFTERTIRRQTQHQILHPLFLWKIKLYRAASSELRFD